MKSRRDLYRLFSLAALLPGAIVLADHGAMLVFGSPGRSLTSTIVLYAVFLSQVALLGWIVGRGLSRPVVSWAVYVWAIVLVNICVFILAADRPRSDETVALGYALISAQFGTLSLWAALGTTRWQWRLPAMGVAAVLLAYFCFPLVQTQGFWNPLNDHEWAVVLVVQCAALVLTSALIRLRGFRLVRLPDRGSSASAPADRDSMQFTIRDMLLWTVAAVPVLVVAKALDWFFVREFSRGDLLPVVVLAVSFTLTSVVAMWSAVGEGRWPVRGAVLAAVALSVGASLSWMAEIHLLGDEPMWFYYRTPFLSHFNTVGRMWIAWTVLAAGFLAAMLLMLRARGYRLARRA